MKQPPCRQLLGRVCETPSLSLFLRQSSRNSCHPFLARSLIIVPIWRARGSVILFFALSGWRGCTRRRMSGSTVGAPPTQGLCKSKGGADYQPRRVMGSLGLGVRSPDAVRSGRELTELRLHLLELIRHVTRPHLSRNAPSRVSSQ